MEANLVVDLGMRVNLDLITTEGVESLEFVLVPDAFADIRLGFLGIGTPIARAILGHKAGENVPYQNDEIHEVQIKHVSPSSHPPPKEILERRQDTLRKAIDQSDRTNAVIFASSFSGKWGDYDPSGFINQDKNQGDCEE